MEGGIPRLWQQPQPAALELTLDYAGNSSTRSISMNTENHVVEAHTAAAQEHENAAKSHRAAAEHCRKGDHGGCEHHAKVALEHSATAHAASTLAHANSVKPFAFCAK
jgi:hypothetical protein